MKNIFYVLLCIVAVVVAVKGGIEMYNEYDAAHADMVVQGRCINNLIISGIERSDIELVGLRDCKVKEK